MDEARAQLVHHLPYFVRVVARVAGGLSPHLRDEAESEALVAMVEATDDWRPETGVPFRRFVSRRIEHRMLDQARRFGYVRTRTKVTRQSYSLDEQAGTGEEIGQTHGDLLESRDASPHEEARTHELDRLVGTLPAIWGIAIQEVGTIPTRPPLAQAIGHGLTILSVRQLETLHRMADGETNAEIAAVMGISTETVKSHVRDVLRKLGAKSRAHAVNIAWERGWFVGVD